MAVTVNKTKTVVGTSTLGRVIKARLCEADRAANRSASLKLLIELKSGETIVVYDDFRADRKVGKLSYDDFLCDAFGVKKVDDLAEAIVEAGETYLCKQVVYPMKGDDGKEITDAESGEIVMSQPHWRVELVF